MNIYEDLKQQYRIGDIVTKLIFWNVLLFVVPEVLVALLRLFQIEINYFSYIALSNNFETLLFKPWTLLSYNFFHGSILHLLLNMIMLRFAGQLFHTFFTQKQLFSVYVLGGIFGGFVYLISYFIFPLLSNQSALLVGASASIMAIVFATTSYQPFMDIRIPLLGKVQLWHIAIVFLLLDLIQLPLENTGGHLAHLGGALFGFLYVKFLQSGVDLGNGLNVILDKAATFFSPRQATPFKKVHKNVSSSNTVKIGSRIVTKDKAQQQIDEILDKISQSGYDSLSKEEKEFLFKAGK